AAKSATADPNPSTSSTNGVGSATVSSGISAPGSANGNSDSVESTDAGSPRADGASSGGATGNGWTGIGSCPGSGHETHGLPSTKTSGGCAWGGATSAEAGAGPSIWPRGVSTAPG